MLRNRRVRPSLLLTLLLLVLGVTGALALVMGITWAAVAQVAAVGLACGIALVLYRGAGEEQENRRVLLKVSEDLSSKLELGDLLDYVVQSILRLVRLADKCVIHLLDERGRRLFPRYSSRPDWERALGMPADKGIAGQAIKSLHTVVVPDVRRSSGFLPLRSGTDLRSLLVAPLHAHGKVLGTISLNSSVPNAFTAQDELLVTTLAAQVSVAIYLSQLYEQALSDNKHIEAIIDNLADGLIVMDGEGCVLRYNPSLAHLLGVDTSRIVGQKLSPDAEDENLRRLAALLGDCVSPMQNCQREVEISEPVRAALTINVVPVPDHTGGWSRVVVVHDRTIELDEVRAKSNFLAAASREILAPLEAIRGYVTLLLSAGTTDRAILTEIRELTKPLLRLAADLADLHAMDRHEFRIRSEPVDLCGQLEAVVAELGYAAERKQVSLDIQCPPSLSSLPLDVERIRHVLLNLLENAIRRSRPGGHVTLRADVTLAELTVTISDDGEPIPADDWAQLLDGTYRSNGPPYDAPLGTGLGVYVSRKIVEACDGQLWRPEVTEGNKFQVILPLNPVPQAERPDGPRVT